MTSTGRDGLTVADAKKLQGKTVDITAWDDDDRTRKVNYRSAVVLGVHQGRWLAIETRRHPLLNVPLGEITSVTIRRAS